jgi:hypothetical protein
LADRRLRVKGRFVKRSEQEQLKKQQQQLMLQEENEQGDEEQTGNAASMPMVEGTAMGSPAAVATAVSNQQGECTTDQDMPDVSDPDAGFVPTEDQPYRRLRRHTIT